MYPLGILGSLSPMGLNPQLYAVGTEGLPEKLCLSILNIEHEILERLRGNPSEIYQISSRNFEELVASMFRRQGFYVELTPPVSDGGFDLLAVQNSKMTGTSKYLIECKRYKTDHKVGVGIVRSLHGVVVNEKATKGILVTTSFFTKGAKEYEKRHINHLSLQNYEAILTWLDSI